MKLDKAQRHMLKIIAIFFAVSLWFYVLNSEPVEIEKKVQVEFVVPDGLIVGSQTDRQLNLVLKGSKAFIGNVLSNKDKVIIDLNPYYKKHGRNFKVQFHPSLISVPFGVDILEMTPKEAHIALDRVGQVELPIKVQYIGSIGVDKRYREESISPSTISVSGPQELLKKYAFISTAPVNLAGIEDEGGTLSLSLDSLDERLIVDQNIKIRLKYAIRPIQRPQER